MKKLTFLLSIILLLTSCYFNKNTTEDNITYRVSEEYYTGDYEEVKEVPLEKKVSLKKEPYTYLLQTNNGDSKEIGEYTDIFGSPRLGFEFKLPKGIKYYKETDFIKYSTGQSFEWAIILPTYDEKTTTQILNRKYHFIQTGVILEPKSIYGGDYVLVSNYLTGEELLRSYYFLQEINGHYFSLKYTTSSDYYNEDDSYANFISIVSSLKSIDIPKVSWKKYENTQYSFSFSYPDKAYIGGYEPNNGLYEPYGLQVCQSGSSFELINSKVDCNDYDLKSPLIEIYNVDSKEDFLKQVFPSRICSIYKSSKLFDNGTENLDVDLKADIRKCVDESEHGTCGEYTTWDCRSAGSLLYNDNLHLGAILRRGQDFYYGDYPFTSYGYDHLILESFDFNKK